jgi:trans-aconitate methyltransferase
VSADWDAQRYHRVSNPQLAWGLRVLDRLPLRGDETVMDAGCGTGRLTAELLGRLPRGRVIAVDQSADMVAAARANLGPRFGHRVEIRQADILSMETDPVDGVFSTATFHWIKDHPRLFAHLHNLVKPGGFLHAQCGGGENVARLHARASALMQTDPFLPHFASWAEPWEFSDAQTTARRLQEAGWVDIHTDVEPAPVTFDGATAFAEFCETVVLRPYLGYLPSAALRTQFVDALTAQAAQDTPPFELDYWRLNMHARR